MNKILKILVVDDNMNGRLMLSKLLTSNNYEVKEARNGIEALESLKVSKPDLIISDILMPGMDGFTLIREIKKDISVGKIPVLFYSAQYLNEKDKEFAEKLGASRFIIKPVEPKDILEEIKNALAEFGSAEQKHLNSHLSNDEEYLSEYAERVFRKLEDKVKELEQEITERKRAEESLKSSEEKYRDLFDNANDAICIVDADLKFKDINNKTLELTGYSKEEFLKMRIFDLIPPEQVPRSKEEFKKLREKGHYEKFIGKILTKSGNMIDVEVNSSAIIENGRITGSRDIIRDITQRKKAEMAVQESEARLKEAQRVAHIGNWEWKYKTNELYWSEENYRIFGLPQEIRPSLDAFFTIVHPDDMEKVKKNIDEALNKMKPYNIIFRITKPDGSQGYVHAMAEVDFDIYGNPFRMYGTVQDVTESKKAEEDLLMFKLGIERSSEAIFITLIDGKITYINPAFEKIYGFSREEALGKKPNILKSGLLPPEAYKTFWDTLLAKKVVTGELINKTRDGRFLNIEGSANPILNNEGDIIGFLAIQRDITDRKKAEDALRKSEGQLKRAHRAAHLGNWEWDLITNELYWAEENYLIHGIDPQKVKPSYEAFIQVVDPAEHEFVNKAVADALAGKGSFDIDYTAIRPDNGEKCRINSKADVIADSIGKAVKMVGTVQDITERKRAEEKIEASLKEKEILLREIHHRVKNNMQIISSLLGLTTGTIKNKKYANMFRESQNRINSMSLIHEKIYRSADLAKIDLKEYIQDLANAILQSRGVKTGTLILKIDIGNVQLGIDHSIPLGLIINELITNSLKYAFPGDRRGEIEVSLHFIDENALELRVSDNGVGIPYDVDFRKTDSLGLRLVTILVENQLKGKIEMHRDKGTEFIIKFQEGNNGKNNGC